MRAPITAVKHLVNITPTTATVGTLNAIDLATAVVSVNANNSSEVVEGATIKAIYLEFWYTGDDAVQGSQQTYFEKRPSASPTMTFTNAGAIFSYPNKKNILFSSQGLTPSNTQNPIPIIRGWVKIPKGKQRFGLGDKLTFNFTGLTDGTVVCGLAIYKEYR